MPRQIFAALSRKTSDDFKSAEVPPLVRGQCLIVILWYTWKYLDHQLEPSKFGSSPELLTSSFPHLPWSAALTVWAQLVCFSMTQVSLNYIRDSSHFQWREQKLTAVERINHNHWSDCNQLTLLITTPLLRGQQLVAWWQWFLKTLRM